MVRAHTAAAISHEDNVDSENRTADVGMRLNQVLRTIEEPKGENELAKRSQYH